MCCYARQGRAQNEQEEEGCALWALPLLRFSNCFLSQLCLQTLKVTTHSKAHKDLRLANENGQFYPLDIGTTFNVCIKTNQRGYNIETRLVFSFKC